MPSGNFATYPTNSIIIQRDARQRRQLTGIPELAESISRTGLIHPIVITRDGVLVAGERRLTAVLSLGWTSIPVQFAEDLDPIQLHLIELEENVKRVQLDWKDEVEAVKRYHDLRMQLDPEWNAEKTAEALSVTPSSVGQKLLVAEALTSNKLVAEAPKFSTARNIAQRERERKRASVLDEVAPVAKPKAPILHADFIEWSAAYTDDLRYNLIHCDFPYGVNADAHDQGAADDFGGYEDSPDVYWNLVAALGRAMTNVVADSAHLVFWFSMDYYAETLDALRAQGWDVNPFPLIWFKSDNTGILPDPNRGPRRVYETAFLASRGDRKIVQPVANTFPAPVVKTAHMSQKNEDMLRHFFRMLVDDTTLLLDPTCGSGSALRAATSLGARLVLGLEQNGEFYERAVAHFNEPGLPSITL